jgi:hypothetical protein
MIKCKTGKCLRHFPERLQSEEQQILITLTNVNLWKNFENQGHR